jgi:hypothetical protein
VALGVVARAVATLPKAPDFKTLAAVAVAQREGPLLVDLELLLLDIEYNNSLRLSRTRTYF